MGVYPNGLVPDVDLKAIQAEMVVALSGWFAAHIKVWDKQKNQPGTYDPVADTTTGGADPILLFDSGPRGAIIQQVRLPAITAFGDQAVGTAGLHIQSLIPEEFCQSGSVVEVVDGGNDPALEQETFVIVDGANSSSSWGRIFRCRSVTS